MIACYWSCVIDRVAFRAQQAPVGSDVSAVLPRSGSVQLWRRHREAVGPEDRVLAPGRGDPAEPGSRSGPPRPPQHPPLNTHLARPITALLSCSAGGVVWRIRASDTRLVCAAGSRNGTEETKLLVLDFDPDQDPDQDQDPEAQTQTQWGAETQRGGGVTLVLFDQSLDGFTSSNRQVWMSTTTTTTVLERRERWNLQNPATNECFFSWRIKTKTSRRRLKFRRKRGQQQQQQQQSWGDETTMECNKPNVEQLVALDQFLFSNQRFVCLFVLLFVCLFSTLPVSPAAVLRCVCCLFRRESGQTVNQEAHSRIYELYIYYYTL